MRVAGDHIMAAAILAGGQGRRMGGAKALVEVEGITLAGHVARVLRADDGALAVVGDAAAAAAISAQAVEDFPGAPSGPLSGVAAALAWAKASRADWLVTAPCDTPLLPADLTARLYEAVVAAKASVACARTQDGLHPLIAIWRTTLAGDIAGRLAQGRHPPVHDVMAELAAAEVLFADAEAFLNVNTPEDLARARDVLACRR